MTRWICWRAVRWALDAPADLPTGPAFTLVALACYADETGRNAYPSTDTLARRARRSKRQVQRDLDELEKRGLIHRGDQGVAEHVRADRRPVVWDLPLPRDDTVSPRTGERDDTVSPRRPRTGRHQRRHGVTTATPRGDTVSPEQNQEKNHDPRTSSRSAARRDTRARPAVARGDSDTRRVKERAAREARERYGLNDDDARAVAYSLTVGGYVPPNEWTEQAWAEAYRDAIGDGGTST
ncbi:helix-turn-helix domain-containing protein [Micromonospora sp. NPDC048930]|uniref:helix-turn-helix domain-containing protein n=1 Tax=Micromonospora sp. NPDC048930 TaxID=3364261 RepID=UPI003723BFF2